jgi:uncharacterized phage protein gp47/JayE
MSDFGITPGGFVVKPLQDILNDKAALAQAAFGPDVDLRSTSALRKLLDVSSAEDLELWKLAEALFYSSFHTTASGTALDLLGDDVGAARRFLKARGAVTLTLSGETPGRTYNLPPGTLVETDAPVQRFRTLAAVALSGQAKKATADVEATARGPAGNVAAGGINKINAAFAQAKLSLNGAQVAVSNANPTTGGDQPEDDDAYRQYLLGRPRTLWTLEAVRGAVLGVDGVRDCRLSDPVGGVDVSLSKFNFFDFGRRKFGTQRRLGTLYFFDVLVAVAPGFLWESTGGMVGVRDAVRAALDEVRPVGIFPNLGLANDVSVGLRAAVRIQPGHDGDAVAAAIKGKLEGRVDALGLGGGVLFSQVMCDITSVAGVLDVQQLHLRRYPPLLGTIAFGGSPRFVGAVIELPVGENVTLQPDEIAVFQVDSQLLDIQVSDV